MLSLMNLFLGFSPRQRTVLTHRGAGGARTAKLARLKVALRNLP
jgi:hypothetical protein